MTLSPVERRTRAGLPVVRFLQTSLPLSMTRWLLKLGMASLRMDPEIKREAVKADGVPCEWIIPPEHAPGQALVYLHGGGFVMGMTPLHHQMAAYWARKMGLRILMVDYRLAPDFPFPAALDDCVTAYGWLLKQGFSPRNLAVAGDSAGGNLTITSLMRLRDSGDPLPAAAACLSPVADLNHPVSREDAAIDPLLPPKAMRFYNRSYVGMSDPKEPLISPVYGNWQGLPPLMVHAGEDEILRGDAIRIGELARAAGVDAQVAIFPRMWHVWQLFLDLPQAVQSLDEIGGFLTSHLGNE